MWYRTYDEWKVRGCFVTKGEKSHKRNEQGQPVFSEQQVTYIPAYGDEEEWFFSIWDFQG